MQKYLISKGWEGFGDRIQCLSNCIVMSQRYNRTLYVDWTDTIWLEGFYRYFHFDGLEYTNDLKTIGQHLPVYPHYWKHKLMLPGNLWMYDMKDQLTFDPSKTYNFEDVWVHCGIGYREYNIVRLAQHLRINSDITPLVYTEPITDLPVVHLRGTDRNFSVDDWQRLRTVAPIANVLSDDTTLIERWMNDSPESIVISNPKPNTTHYTVDGVDKHQMNLALLKEFFIIASAKTAYPLNNDSLYFKMARMLGSCPDYKSMFVKN